MNEQIVIVHHNCGHVQEHVSISFSENQASSLWERQLWHDWKNRLEQVPCLRCCRVAIVKAQRDLDKLDAEVNEF